MNPWRTNSNMLLQQARERNAYAYLNQLGIYGRVKYMIKGVYLVFRYNLQTARGMKTIERQVNLDNFKFKDKPLKRVQSTELMLNVCTGQFV